MVLKGTNYDLARRWNWNITQKVSKALSCIRTGLLGRSKLCSVRALSRAVPGALPRASVRRRGRIRAKILTWGLHLRASLLFGMAMSLCLFKWNNSAHPTGIAGLLGIYVWLKSWRLCGLGGAAACVRAGLLSCTAAYSAGGLCVGTCPVGAGVGVWEKQRRTC